MEELQKYVMEVLDELDKRQQFQVERINRLNDQVEWLHENMKDYREYLELNSNDPRSIIDKCLWVIEESEKGLRELEEIDERVTRIEKLLDDIEWIQSESN